MKSKIIYEDDEILICHKPAGLPTQTGNVGQADCVSELKNYLYEKQRGQGEPYLGVIHRLDQPVEGLLVFARTKQAAQALTAQLQNGIYGKRYYAVVDGLLPERACAGENPASEDEVGEDEAGTEEDMLWTELVHYLKKDGKSNLAQIVPPQKRSGAKAGAKEARMRYRVLKRQKELQISKIEVELETGRFHQIRAQMSAHGYPLLGDVKYGTEMSCQKSAAHGVRNVALCAYSLNFRHPKSGRQMDFSCQPENGAFSLF